MPHPRDIPDEDFRKKFEWPVRTCMQNGRALSLVNNGMRGQRGFVLSVVKLNGDALRLATSDLKDDYEVARTAIQHDFRAVQFASERLRNDPNFMMDVFKKDSNALKFATDALLNDASFMLKAVRHNSAALHFFPDELKADKEFMEVVIEVCANKDLLQHAAPCLQSDPEFVALCLEFNGLALEHADAALQDKKDIVMLAVQQNGLALEFASKRLRNDHRVVSAAVTQDGAALVFAPVELRKDRQILTAATRGQPQLEGRLATLLSIKERAQTAPENMKRAQARQALENLRPSSAGAITKGGRSGHVRPSSAVTTTSGQTASSESALAVVHGQPKKSPAVTTSQGASRRQVMRAKKQHEERQWREDLVPIGAPRLSVLCEDDNIAKALGTRSPSKMLEAEILQDDAVINAIAKVPSSPLQKQRSGLLSPLFWNRSSPNSSPAKSTPTTSPSAIRDSPQGSLKYSNAANTNKMQHTRKSVNIGRSEEVYY